MSAFPTARTAIVGAATFGEGHCPGYTPYDMAAIAARDALAEAGLSFADVDGVFVTTSTDTFGGGTTFAQYCGIQPKVADNSRTGGNVFESYVERAAWLLDAGLIDCALIAYGSNQGSTTGKLAKTSQPFPYEAPYGPLMPISAYAMAAARHMHEFGTTKEQLGEVAIAARAWAQLNPAAAMRDPLTMDEYLGSRMISDPFAKLDCCLVTDGAAAVVMTRADRARDRPKVPVWVRGAASMTTHSHISAMPDLLTTALAECGPRALAQAGLSPREIDVVELYDAFTINTILFLEDLGFCPKGEGGRFVAGGAIAPGGSLPVNTNGGGLSCVHPGMYGLFTIVEAVRQLRGECGDRQVTDARTAIAQGNGGVLSSQAITVLTQD
ncbi:acetyl-CoA acetyltransferase [Mesorhizobium sp. B4-1-4]|uniref:acetyl-CoA acetyltransferase n=1 Tax=Mesorhizobium sp. B4-1-4 TaxID=2589888 RepID=UPI001129A6F0|nr:acetyl-CoA acetyltransferase [Mesorhizobium sp. B4-1-4]UCI31880.1 thiolase [Mesorhizobium sp. B4-1-4]